MSLRSCSRNFSHKDVPEGDVLDVNDPPWGDESDYYRIDYYRIDYYRIDYYRIDYYRIDYYRIDYYRIDYYRINSYIIGHADIHHLLLLVNDIAIFKYWRGKDVSSLPLRVALST